MKENQSQSLRRSVLSYVSALSHVPESQQIALLQGYCKSAALALDALSALPIKGETNKAQTVLRQALFQVARDFPGVARIAHVAHLESNKSCKLLLVPGVSVNSGRTFSIPVLARWDAESGGTVVVIGARHSTSIPFGKYTEVDPYIVGVFANEEQLNSAASQRLRAYA